MTRTAQWCFLLRGGGAFANLRSAVVSSVKWLLNDISYLCYYLCIRISFVIYLLVYLFLSHCVFHACFSLVCMMWLLLSIYSFIYLLAFHLFCALYCCHFLFFLSIYSYFLLFCVLYDFCVYLFIIHLVFSPILCFVRVPIGIYIILLWFTYRSILYLSYSALCLFPEVFLFIHLHFYWLFLLRTTFFSDIWTLHMTLELFAANTYITLKTLRLHLDYSYYIWTVLKSLMTLNSLNVTLRLHLKHSDYTFDS